MFKAVCPLCGGVAQWESAPGPQVTCPLCGRALEAQLNGRAVILRAPAARAQEDPRAAEWVKKAEKEPDAVKRYGILSEGLKAHPDSLGLNRALLFHGRLHERDPRKIDYTIIKSYLLHLFEEPQAHEPQEQEGMLKELFHHPQLERCLALAPDGEAFMADYLEALCAQYIDIFLKGSSRHMTSMFGIPLGRPEKNLSRPAARMLRAMAGEERLDPRQRQALYQAFYRAYRRCLGSSDHLDALLKEAQG